MIRIQRQPSSPPRGPIAASPRASRPRSSADSQVEVQECTYHRMHPTKTSPCRTDRFAEPGHHVYRKKKDIAPGHGQISLSAFTCEGPLTIPGSRPPSAIPKRARTATKEP